MVVKYSPIESKGGKKVKSGYFRCISACKSMPYDQNSIYSFLQQIMPLTKSMTADYLDLLPFSATFENVLEKACPKFLNQKIEKQDFEQKLLSRVYIEFKDGLTCKLTVCFLDKCSYEVCCLFEKENLMDKLEHIHNMSCKLFNAIKPIYGFIGMESNVCGIKEIIDGEFYAPTNKIYFCEDIVKTNGSIIEQMFKDSRSISMNSGKLYISETENMPDMNTQDRMCQIITQYIRQNHLC